MRRCEGLIWEWRFNSLLCALGSFAVKICFGQK